MALRPLGDPKFCRAARVAQPHTPFDGSGAGLFFEGGVGHAPLFFHGAYLFVEILRSVDDVGGGDVGAEGAVQPLLLAYVPDALGARGIECFQQLGVLRPAFERQAREVVVAEGEAEAVPALAEFIEVIEEPDQAL